MAWSAAEERQIFLACKAIFTGPNASLRKLKAIQKRIADHQTSLHNLVPNFDIKRAANIAQHLLQKQVFQSDIKAKMEFPDLFAPSPAREIQHDTFETEAARSAAEVLEEITSVHQREEDKDTEVPPTSLPVDIRAPVETGILVDEEIDTSPGSAVELRLLMPSLYPSYFPYQAQHSILSAVQQVLEECCFDFAKKWFPSEVEDHRWDCAAAVELTKWTRLLAKWSPRLPDGTLQLNGSRLDALLSPVCKIRHTAVHRLPTTARGISMLILSAIRLAEALQDPLRTSQLEDLHLDIQNKIKAMELNKNALEDNLAHELRVIQLRREDLDQKEEQLRAKTISSDRENNILMGLLVKESMEKIFDDGKKQLDYDSTGFTTADDGAEDE